jgi:hypothetical protein
MVRPEPQANLLAGMRWLQNTCTRRFNLGHQLWGRLFDGRYKAVLVEGGEFGGGDYRNLIDYVHYNPVRVKPATHLAARKTGEDSYDAHLKIGVAGSASESRGSRSLSTKLRIPAAEHPLEFVVQDFGPRL